MLFYQVFSYALYNLYNSNLYVNMHWLKIYIKKQTNADVEGRYP